MNRSFRPFRPARPLRLVALALGLALVVSACSDNGVQGSYAAKVGSQTVSERAFLRELAQFRNNAAASEAFGLQSSDGTVDSQLTAAWLNALLQDALVREEFDRRELAVSEAEHAGAEQLAMQQFGGEQVWSQFDGWFRDRVTARLARIVKLQEQVGGQISEAELKEEFEATKGEFEERVCVAHILVDTEAKALEIKAALDGGGDFAQLAAENSTDPGSGAQGGELGCHPEGSFVGPFEEAAWSLPPDQLSEPVETQFGWHLVLVHSRGAPAFEDVRGEIEGRLQQESRQRFAEVMNDLLQGLDVEINPKYGTFDPGATTGAFVLPPGSPQVSDGPPSADDGAPPLFELEPQPAG